MSQNWKPRLSTESKKKISESVKSYQNKFGVPNEKAVLQFDLEGIFIKEWKSAREASNNLGINYKGISAVVTCTNGRYKTYKGFIWKLKI